jgi:hypothetical protein
VAKDETGALNYSPVVNPDTTWSPYNHTADSQSGVGEGPTPLFPYPFGASGPTGCDRQPYRIWYTTCSNINAAVSNPTSPYPATRILAQTALFPGETCRPSVVGSDSIRTCDPIYAFVEDVQGLGEWRPIRYTMHLWTNVFGYPRADADGLTGTNVVLQGSVLGPDNSGPTGPTGIFFMPPHLTKLDWSASAEWLQNSPTYSLTDGEINHDVKILLTPGNHTNPFATTVTNVLQGPTGPNSQGPTGPNGETGPTGPSGMALQKFLLDSHYLGAGFQIYLDTISAGGPLFDKSKNFWYPYWNYATTQSFMLTNTITCSPTNEYTIFVASCGTDALGTTVYALWPGVGPLVDGQQDNTPPSGPIGATACGPILHNITGNPPPAPTLRITMPLCSSIVAFAYVNPNIQTYPPVHYSASFYTVEAGTQLEHPYRPFPGSTPTTLTWSADTEWITTCLADPTSCGITQLFETLLGSGVTSFTYNGVTINATDCIPLLVGANETRNK